MTDGFNRKIDYVRISLTDRCNFKCSYCMPQGMEGMTVNELSYSEVVSLCKALAPLGVTKVKLTGGEPLLHKDIINIIRDIKAIDGITQVTLTTNGLLLDRYLPQLNEAGIDSINISMDAVNRELFHSITQVDGADKIIDTIKKTQTLNMNNIKINCVLIKDCNEAEYVKLAKFSVDYNISVKFIEMMPIGYGKTFDGFTLEDLKESLEKEYGKLIPLQERFGNGPAVYYKIAGGLGQLGFIGALSHKFCQDCNRIRITSSGDLKTCLQYSSGVSLREHLNSPKLKDIIEEAVRSKQESHKFKELEINNEEIMLMSSIGG